MCVEEKLKLKIFDFLFFRVAEYLRIPSAYDVNHQIEVVHSISEFLCNHPCFKAAVAIHRAPVFIFLTKRLFCNSDLELSGFRLRHTIARCSSEGLAGPP